MLQPRHERPADGRVGQRRRRGQHSSPPRGGSGTPAGTPGSRNSRNYVDAVGMVWAPAPASSAASGGNSKELAANAITTGSGRPGRRGVDAKLPAPIGPEVSRLELRHQGG